MPSSLYDFVSQQHSTRHAIRTGTNMHQRLQCIVIDKNIIRGDAELIQRISANAELAKYFSSASRTEVPVAGTINGRFISRRIDRMIIDQQTKSIKILDYKTDTDRYARCEKYKRQLREYQELLSAAYPGFNICAAILWTHDWALEHV